MIYLAKLYINIDQYGIFVVSVKHIIELSRKMTKAMKDCLFVIKQSSQRKEKQCSLNK
jgi:hypothetical protein